MTNETTILGMSLFNAPQGKLDEIHRAIFDGLSKGALSPSVSRQFDLLDAPLAHHAIIEEKANGKIVLVP